MKTAVSTSDALDFSAVGLSILCLIHCLALPVLSVLLPILGALAEAEWVHRLLVLFAVPITLLAMWRGQPRSSLPQFAIPAGAGLLLLMAAAFVEALHDFETPLTTVGAVLLGTAHLLRWRRRAL